jgi:hypothetical protein
MERLQDAGFTAYAFPRCAPSPRLGDTSPWTELRFRDHYDE